MLPSVWSRLRRRHSLLPARDMFDADLDRARRKPGCALCRLVCEHDQQGMHSFLWEYCTDPQVGAQIGASWGFCPYHTWSLAVMEHEHMGDGLGISSVYQAVLRQLQRHLASEQHTRKQIRQMALPAGPAIGSAECRFCQSAKGEESQFLTRLVKRFQDVITSLDGGEWSSLQAELCLPHLEYLLQACARRGATPSFPWQRLCPGNRAQAPGVPLDQEIHTLATLLTQQPVKHSMELDAHAQDMEDMWSQVAEQLAFLVGSLNAVPLHLCHNSQQAVSRQLLLLTGPDSQLRSPSSSGCPVCLATASACIATCMSAFEGEMPLPQAASFCQSHHWILAASMVLHSLTDNRGRYHSWLKQQFEQRQAALIGAQSYETAQHGQHCLACSSVAESSGQAIASLIRALPQGPDGSTRPGETLLCLFHWQQAHEACTRKPETRVLQARLLHRQQKLLAQLDSVLEAYLARFNAAKRERGEVPDIPEAAWAWERLLAFFAGEPALVFSMNT
jgi:hypothetical protein